MGSLHRRSFKITTLILLIAASFSNTIAQNEIKDKRCKGIYFSNRYFDVDIVKEGLNNVHQILLNRNDNTLYFIIDQIATVPTRVLGYINLDTRKAGIVEGVRNATCIAIDQTYNKVYVGGSDGIFRLSNEKFPMRIGVQDNIQSIYFKDVIYYTNARNEAFIYYNGDISPVFELQGVAAGTIILDDDHNIFFTQGKTLFRVKMGTRAVNSHEQYRTSVLATDSYDKPYVVTNAGTFVYNKYKYVFDKVSDISGLKALTFNKSGEPIYVVYDLIIHLKVNPVKCIEPIF